MCLRAAACSLLLALPACASDPYAPGAPSLEAYNVPETVAIIGLATLLVIADLNDETHQRDDESHHRHHHDDDDRPALRNW